MARKAWLDQHPPMFQRAYKSYEGIVDRCNNPRCHAYPRYGGRGIELKISREDFIEWFTRTAKGRLNLTIDRIDNDGPYEPGNIQLITKARNTQKAQGHQVRVGDRVFESFAEAGRTLGNNYMTVWRRFSKGQPMPDGSSIELVVI